MTALAFLFDQYAGMQPEDPCWITDGKVDEAHDYCRKCAAARIERDGAGYLSTSCAPESDHCVHCDACGKLLNYSLTAAGADAELDHFQSVRFRKDKRLDRETAFHLARMLAAKGDDFEATEVAARAIRCMRSIPKIAPKAR
jgi:hypothetical protein